MVESLKDRHFYFYESGYYSGTGRKFIPIRDLLDGPYFQKCINPKRPFSDLEGMFISRKPIRIEDLRFNLEDLNKIAAKYEGQFIRFYEMKGGISSEDAGVPVESTS